MSSERFACGDRVRHPARPEWGIGSVLKVEELPVNGAAAQSLSIRFASVGVKTINTAHAKLERVTPGGGGDDVDRAVVWDELKEDWLGPLAQRKIEQAMTSLPEEARDPFNGLRRRLELVLGLYRFDRSGRGLIDWAVAQTGLDDPLSRFNRHELERFFDRWVTERDAQLFRLLQEAEGERDLVNELISRAPAAGQRAARKVMAAR
jgi:hypothetical protein